MPKANTLHKKQDTVGSTGFFWAFLIAVVVVLADQLSKAYFRTHDLTLASWFALHPSVNTGAAFSMAQGQSFMFVWLSLIALGILIFVHDYIPRTWTGVLGYTFVIAGIIGNLIDRLRFGGVTDFIALSFWPSFNVADAALVVGVLLLVFVLWKK